MTVPEPPSLEEVPGLPVQVGCDLFHLESTLRIIRTRRTRRCDRQATTPIAPSIGLVRHGISTRNHSFGPSSWPLVGSAESGCCDKKDVEHGHGADIVLCSCEGCGREDRVSSPGSEHYMSKLALLEGHRLVLCSFVGTHHGSIFWDRAGLT